MCSLKNFISVIPVLIGIIVGYVCSIIAGIVNFEGIKQAKWFEVPDLMIPFATYTPSFSWSIIVVMLLASIVTLSEHIGHQMVLSKVVGRNF